MVLNIYKFMFPGLPRVHCLFQGRGPGGGNISLKADNGDEARRARKELLAFCAADGMRDWRELKQEHGDKVVEADESNGIPAADGICANSPGIGLMIKTADCQPLLFAHKSGSFIMAIHSGWRGNRMDFPFTATGVFCEKYKIFPRDILVVRGPSLGPGFAEFTNFDREWGNGFKTWFDQKTKCMDLWKLSQSQLERAGIPAKNIYGVDLCTAANHDKFFSWRRDKTPGRQASLVWIDGRMV